MAQTFTQKAGNGNIRIATGRQLDTGTVAARTITVGFQPRFVRVVNNTSGDEMTWIEGMPDAYGFKRLAAGTGSQVTSNGITPTANGFIFGLDTDLNVTSEQITWYAEG